MNIDFKFAEFSANLFIIFLTVQLKFGGKNLSQGITYQIRCPICNGRLFDIISENPYDTFESTQLFTVFIKCWKCHQTIQLGKLTIANYLVQASPNL
jgi:hypothetical protein